MSAFVSEGAGISEKQELASCPTNLSAKLTLVNIDYGQFYKVTENGLGFIANKMRQSQAQAMIHFRKSSDRGFADHGWLKSYHTFSFAEYFDRNHMRFGHLRVINEDWVAPQTGFPLHGHRDMEIVTFILEGELTHTDTLGHSAVIRPGEIQKMSAGTGIEHSEMNQHPSTSVHLYQIWIYPREKNLQPKYEQVKIHTGSSALTLIGGPTLQPGQVQIHQDCRIFWGRLQGAQSLSQPLDPQRLYWIQCVKGEIQLNNQKVIAGDGAGVSDEKSIEFASLSGGEFLFFDMSAN